MNPTTSKRPLAHPSRLRFGAALLALGFLAAACGGTNTDAATDREAAGEAETPASSAVDTLTEALGDIESTTTYSYLASGSRHEPGQGQRPGDVVDVSEFDVSVITDLSGDRLRLDWLRTMGRQTVVPDAVLAYTEIVRPDAGYIDGNDAVFEIGSSRPMNSARVAAVQRQQLLLQPHLALAQALNEGHEIEFAAGVADVIEIDDPRGSIRLQVDPASRDLLRLFTTESDPLTGDAEITVEFDDWEQIADLRIAASVELAVDGIVVHREQRSGFDTTTIDEHDFALTETVAVDRAGFEQGWTNSQWFNRGLALPFGAGFVDQTLDAPVEVVRTSDEVIVVAGTRHNTVLVDIGESVVMIEPSINADRSRQVLEVAATEFNKPVSHVVLTHDHHDQIGGVRGAVAHGAVAVLPSSDRDFIQSVVTQERLIDPDLLSRNTAEVPLETVDESWSTPGGEVTAHRFSSIHDQDMLVVCIPRTGLAFNSDLFNPGFGPPDAPLPEPQRTFAAELLDAIQTNCPYVTGVLGSHGAPIPAPIEVLTANAGTTPETTS